ncbi:MAG: hypothetical protein L0Y71_03120 [Gemmataceae bacterium]|nr:hypothetical protein [Gemmataceae bacterium]
MNKIREFFELLSAAGPVTAPSETTPLAGDEEGDPVAQLVAGEDAPAGEEGRAGDDAPVQQEDVGTTPVGEKAGMSAERILYNKERAAVAKLRSDLGKHKQAAHVSDKTGQADAALSAAATHAATPDWPKAMAELASAKKACEDGKGFADKFADFLVKRAEANLVLTAAQTSGWTVPPALSGALGTADSKAAPPGRNYASAKTDLDTIINGLAPFFKKFYVDDVKPKITTLKALPGAKFITAEISAIDKLMSQQETGITAKQWRQVRLNAGLISDRITMATKIANRRTGFDAERPKADAAVKTLEAHGAAVAAPLAQIKQRLKDADALATKTGMQFEDATDQVGAIVKDCEAFDRLARDAAAYTKERGALAGELTGLRKHVAADKFKAELDVARGLLDEAAKAAGDPGAPGTTLALGTDRSKHDISTANARLAQARADLAAAKGLADGLDGVATAEAALKGAANLTDVRKAADALAKELASAKTAAHADLAKTEFDAAQTALDEAKKKIDEKQADAAALSLKTAGEKLTAGRRLQIEHSRFVERHAALTKRLEQHNADANQAKKIKAKIDALAKALSDADAAEKANDHAKAMADLNAAETAAGAADAALVARVAFDKEANLAQLDLDQPAYASVKTAQLAELTKARGLADAFDFAGANKALKTIRNKMGAAEAEGMAKKTPPDPKLADKAKKLAESGATKELDDLIKSLPNTVDKQVFIDLAQARFKGVNFEVDPGNSPQAAIKRMCDLMKDVPDDIIGNPSLKKISRKATGGAFYRPSEDLVVMNSRPGASPKADFQPGVTGRLPEREEDCKPANNNPEDLFDFNMLHEVAHAIDDAKNYMGQNGGKPECGGWIEHGGDIKPIVEAVIAATGFGKSAEERKYVTDMILRNPAVAPTTFKGDKDKFDKFIAAAQTDGVWSNQALSEQATLGKRIYQEAYPNTWVSYLADARKRGITGYQFRAPGECFAELYAAWKLGKLKPQNPAVKWLSKIKI